jgi:hypothetical protein
MGGDEAPAEFGHLAGAEPIVKPTHYGRFSALREIMKKMRL